MISISFLRNIFKTSLVFEDTVNFTISRRNYRNYKYLPTGNEKRVRSVAIQLTNTTKKNEQLDFERGNLNVDELQKDFRKDLRKEFKMKGDIGAADLDALSNDSFDQADGEYKKLQVKFRQSKMYRRHFKQILGGNREVCVLTYAEKEKIKYLHTTNPEEWTPEALSTSFPISPEGVVKLVKSTFKLRSIQEIQNHDKLVVDKIEKIRNGEISMTPDLEEKMKMRDKIPFNVGAIDPYDKNMLLMFEPVKIVGEFQRLVAPAPKPNSQTKDVATLPQNEMLSQSRQENQFESSVINQTQPDLGDFYTMKPEESQPRHLAKSLRKVMTFDEFKSKIIKTGGVKKSNPEIQHLRNLSQKPEIVPTKLSDFENDDDDDGTGVENKILNPTFIQKFESANENDLENEKEYEQQRMTSINKHHDRDNQIKNNQRQRIEGKSYYDDNGEFLYKVV